ncbi:MAG: T9SS type A sorting domain-containing protein [Flavobacteriales bacterium]|nr:T9SS type A sorting domain-containing protein [Flavobacteriales bacterium]
MMKYLTLLLLVLSANVQAQTWKTIPMEHYNISSYNGANIVSTNYSQFEINPYDGTMWFISNKFSSGDFNIKRINNDGSMTFFTPSNMPFMDVNSRYFIGVDFSSSKTFLLHEFDGALSYDGTTWVYEGAFDKGTYVSSDADTLYFGREGESLVRISETDVTFNYTNCRRLAAKNGNAWRSSSFYDFIQKLNSTLDVSTSYNPDTCNLLSTVNNDFKFARNSDTLYVAGEQGFSLAYGETFVDTITMNNAPNMPYPSIIEFEFDSQDNIWAVFGDGGTLGFYPQYIGYYDRSVQDWTLVYHQSNCPVDFTKRLDIEIDPDDNLWVCDIFDLHVLKINNTPSWLSLVEEENSSFSVFPNPSSGVLSIQTEANVSDIEVRDLSGRLVKTIKYTPEISIEKKGTYILRLLDHGAVVGNQKVVIE